MPYRIGFLLYALLPLGLILSKRGPVTTFLKAGAISPETARKPTAIKAGGDLAGPLKRGTLVSTGDGRYYVNTDALKRQQRTTWIVLVVGAVVLTAVLLWLWSPWA